MSSVSIQLRHPPDHFLNRELSLLAFQRRVLAQASDACLPLLERLRFLCIVSSNLDEFFEVRVAGLKERLRFHSRAITPDGRTARETFRQVASEVHALIADQYALLNLGILPALADEGVRFLRRTSWSEAQAGWIQEYFFREVMPLLTPIGLDPAHPFPRVLNKSLNFAVELEGRDAFGRSSGTAIVQAPRVLPRVIRLPESVSGAGYSFVFLSSILHAHVGELFSGMSVIGCYQFRVTRNSDLFVDEEEVTNLRTALQGELPQRHFGDAVRLEVADNCSERMAGFLLTQFGLTEEDLYRVSGPVNLVRLTQVPEWVERPDLKFPGFEPAESAVIHGCDTLFAAIRRGDILLHHPFQSFTTVASFIASAAEDPAVMAVKMTVYRTGTDSELMQSLIQAAERGKEVTVVFELLARFDEEANINWAARLEAVGAHVVYGVVGYKTHAKMTLVVRREADRLRQYVHFGTGNYHPRTARLYTDFGLLTAHPGLCEDASEVFKQLTGLGQARPLSLLLQAPFSLHDRMMAAIRFETDEAQAGRPARIIAKMNALLEPEIIEALYLASQAGVRIDLLVRGACALRPQVPGLSDRIRVRSIIGRFLEHSRIFHFHAAGQGEVWLSSADWMDRNFFRRIELAFPILNPRLRRRVIREGLTPYLADNTQAWEMDADGRYRLRRGRGRPHNAQERLLDTLTSTPS